MDTPLVQLTVSGLVGLSIALTLCLTLIVLGVKTIWELAVETIVWSKMPWAERIDQAVEAAEDVLSAP